jgi:uncharacterized membrane protein
VLMREDTGMVTISVKNTGAGSVTIKGADFYAKELTTLNYRTYGTTMNLGPGDSTDFTFTVRADASEGIYYPKFYLDLGAESFRYYVPLKVENTPIDVSILDRPDSFAMGVKDTITLVIGNPRESILSGVTVTPQGSGIETKQTKVFIGDLEPGESTRVNIEIIPSLEGDLTFLVEYRNGINKHSEAITIPISFGSDKLAARPMMNSIELSSSGTTYTLSADVTNAGLTDANSIVVTVGNPAQGVDPNPVYIVGTLEPDDFSSFELTFTVAPGTSSIPVILQYKDADGNEFEETFMVNLGANTGLSNGPSGSGASTADSPPGMGGQVRGGALFGGMGTGFRTIPIVQIVLVMIAVTGVAVAWRKGYLGTIKTRLKR